MSVKATELRKGMVIVQGEDLLLVTDYHHSTPGNWRAIIHVKLRSLKSGQNSQLRPGSGDTFETAYLERKKCQYLYKESNGDYVFMDEETYEQFHLDAETVAEKMVYVKENQAVDVNFHGPTPISIALPASVVLRIVEAEAAVKGNTATNVKKDAVLETGLKIKVPLHINAGDLAKVNTETGEFLGRSSGE
jgi:elongation factor P